MKHKGSITQNAYKFMSARKASSSTIMRTAWVADWAAAAEPTSASRTHEQMQAANRTTADMAAAAAERIAVPMARDKLSRQANDRADRAHRPDGERSAFDTVKAYACDKPAGERSRLLKQ